MNATMASDSGSAANRPNLDGGPGVVATVGLIAMIFGADHLGLPVSTKHVLSSGVAGTMAANRSGLQMSTIRNLLLAWVLTLPVSIILAGGLYMLFSQVI